MVVAGCGGDPAPSSEAAGETPTEIEGEQAGPPLPEPITAAGARSVPLKDRLIKRTAIPDGPDWLADAFGSIWVKRDNGMVDRVDAKSGRIIAEISPGRYRPPLCQGIGVSEDAVWACARGDELIRIDPDSNSIVATVRVKDKLPEQGHLVTAAGQLWVITDAGEKLTPVGLTTNQPGAQVKLDSKCTELAAEGSTLYAMCPFEGRVLKIDARSGELIDDLELANARRGAIGEDLWVGFSGGVAQVDLRNLEVLAVYEGEVSYEGAIFATPRAVWFREPGERFLTKIDPGAGRIVETLETSGLPNGGDVVLGGGSLWATDSDANVLVQLEPSP